MPTGICYGRLDVALAPQPDLAGIAGRLAALPRFSLWSSPMLRCLAVADAIAAAFSTPIRKDARLLELDFGAWEGMPWSDVPCGELDRWAACPADFAPPGGESGASLIARITEFHSNLKPGPHVVVSHGGPLRLLAALAEGRRVDLLARPPDLGSVHFVGRSGADAGSDGERDALGENRGGAEDISGVAADLPTGQRGHAEPGERGAGDAGQRGTHGKQA